MKLTTGFKYGLRILCQRSTIVILAVFSFSISCFLCSIYTFQGLIREMSGEVELQCTVPQGMEDSLGQLKNVSYISEYQQSMQILSYNGYSVEIQLMGYEKEYFMERFRENIAAEMSGSMPYIVVESGVFSEMKNDSREKMNVVSDDSLLMENFLVSGKNARICGIVNTEIADEVKEDLQDTVFYVYTTLEGYGALTDLSDGNAGDGIPVEESADFSEAVFEEGGSRNVLIGIRSGFHLKDVTELLNRNGVSILAQNGDFGGGESDQITVWTEEKASGIENMVLFVFLFACSLMLMNNQRKIWALEHWEFLQYIKMNAPDGKSVRMIYTGAVLWYLMAGFGLGGVAAVLRCIGL